MTYLEIDKAIVDITRQKCTECKARLDAIPKENATERKAVQLECGIYSFCGSAGLMFNGGDRERVLQGRRRFFESVLSAYPRLNEVYQAAEEEEKHCLIAALQGEIFIRDQWLKAQLAEQVTAEASGDTKSVFELTIKIGAAQNMLAAWEAWRVENNVYPHMLEEEKV